MKIGYARVSTEDQNLDLQCRALKKAGCGRVFEDRVSGATLDRPGLEKALASMHRGDLLVVWKLDRLGRSVLHLVNLIQKLGERDIGFISLSENIDTTTAAGRLIFHVMSSIAEFERALIAERTKAGMAAARKRGVHVGRKRAINARQMKRARFLIGKGKSPTAIARGLRVSRSTLYRALGRGR